jgi:hypothetical protein
MAHSHRNTRSAGENGALPLAERLITQVDHGCDVNTRLEVADAVRMTAAGAIGDLQQFPGWPCSNRRSRGAVNFR